MLSATTAKECPNSALLGKISRVHHDDVHGIAVTKKGDIVSGSKDTSIKSFNLTPDFKCRAQYVLSQAGQDYQQWVTAIDLFPDDSLLAGHRNGYLLSQAVYAQKGRRPLLYTRAKDILAKDIKYAPFYKERNQNRIMGIKSIVLPQFQYSALIGFAENFCHYDFQTNQIKGIYRFEKPEWVYGFCQLSDKTAAIIHGACLSAFAFSCDEESLTTDWKIAGQLVVENRMEKQRPFISSVFPMQKLPAPVTEIAISLFGGTTQVIDVSTAKPLHSAQEHKQRVWQTVPFSSKEYISCSDDGTVKVWDVRTGNKSLFTYADHPGRVSAVALLRDDQPIFVAGTCASDPAKDPEKGQFYFYDIRKSTSAKVFTSLRLDEDLAGSLNLLSIDPAAAEPGLGSKQKPGQLEDEPAQNLGVLTAEAAAPAAVSSSLADSDFTIFHAKRSHSKHKTQRSSSNLRRNP